MDPFKVYMSNLPFALSSSVLAAALLDSGFTVSNVIIFNKGRSDESRPASALVQFETMDFCKSKVSGCQVTVTYNTLNVSFQNLLWWYLFVSSKIDVPASSMGHHVDVIWWMTYACSLFHIGFHTRHCCLVLIGDTAG
jgi:uncharacterized membrane protein YphA (DoxX/SURF4 family)